MTLLCRPVFYDDGSTDDTYTLLQQYQSDNLKIVRNDTNQGYARTLIRALSECETEWVMMVADDDVFVPGPGQLQELMTWLHGEKPDFVCTQCGLRRMVSCMARTRPNESPMRSSKSLVTRAPGSSTGLPSCARPCPCWIGLERGSDAALVYPQVVLVAQPFRLWRARSYTSRAPRSKRFWCALGHQGCQRAKVLVCRVPLSAGSRL